MEKEEEKEEEVILRMGPWGGGVGTETDTGVLNQITSLQVYAGDVLHSIKITYKKTTDAGGGEQAAVVETCSIGGNGGRTFPPIALEEGEFIRFVSGTVVEYMGRRCVSALRFRTNYKAEAYGPYGDRRLNGVDFSLPVENGKIVGFFGRADTHVNAIGVYVTPLDVPGAPPSSSSSMTNEANDPSVN